MEIDPDDWTGLPDEEVQFFGENNPNYFESKPSGPARKIAQRNTVSKSGARVMSVGDFVKDWLENPRGMNFGLGTGGKATSFSPTDPTMPTQIDARYGFRATGPQHKPWGEKAGGVAERNPFGDPSLDDFIRRGSIQSPLGNPAFVSMGKADPFYLEGEGGHVFIVDTQTAAYDRGPHLAQSGFEDWKLRNPSYDLIYPQVPDSPLRRAAWAANPMNRTGLAILEQGSTTPELYYMPDETNRTFVLRNPKTKNDPLRDVQGVTTTRVEPYVRGGGANEQGVTLRTADDVREALEAHRGITVNTDSPLYDRITPFTQRSIGTHLANLNMEARIARHTIPALAREAAPVVATAVGKVATPTIGAVGFGADVMTERAKLYDKIPPGAPAGQEFLAWANAAENSMLNIINPAYYADAVVGGLAGMRDRITYPKTLPSDPRAIMATYGASNAQPMTNQEVKTVVKGVFDKFDHDYNR